MSEINTDELCQDDENDDAEDASSLYLVCGEYVCYCDKLPSNPTPHVDYKLTPILDAF